MLQGGVELGVRVEGIQGEETAGEKVAAGDARGARNQDEVRLKGGSTATGWHVITSSGMPQVVQKFTIHDSRGNSGQDF